MKNAIAMLLGVVIALLYVVFAFRSYVNGTRTGYIYEPSTQRLFSVSLHQPVDQLNYWKPLVPEVVRPPTLLDGRVLTGVDSLADAVAAQCDAGDSATKAEPPTGSVAGKLGDVSTFSYRVRDDIDAGSMLPEVWQPLRALSSHWDREVFPVEITITTWSSDAAIQPRIEHIPKSLFVRGGPSLHALEKRGLNLRLCGLVPAPATGP